MTQDQLTQKIKSRIADRNKRFVWQGFAFVPVFTFADLGLKGTLKDVTPYLNDSHEHNGFYRIPGQNPGAGWNHDKFYAASGDCEDDIFLCLDNYRLYCPCTNTLFLFIHPKLEQILPGLKPSITLKDIEIAKYHVVSDRKTLQEFSRDTVARILKSIPSGQLVSGDCLGLVTFETTGGEFTQEKIHGLCLDDEDGSITVTSELNYDKDGNPTVRNWLDPYREKTFPENDICATVDWMTTLELISDHIERNPKIIES